MADQKGPPSDPPPAYSQTLRTPASPSSSAAAAPEQQQQQQQQQQQRRGPAIGPSRRVPLNIDVPILNYMKSNRVILASGSPRRKALLGQLGLTYLEILPSTKPEDLDKSKYNPHEYVVATARQKCLDVYQMALSGQPPSPTSSPDTRDPALVIAADTIVVSRDGRILEKPRNREEHIRMLRHLRDTRVHSVLTAVCALAPREDARHPGYELGIHTEETKVYFARESDGLPDDVIEAYVKTGEGADKAGGYAVQGIGGLLLVERVEGNVDNVIGLPVRRTLALAEKVIFRQNEDGEQDEEDEEED